VLATFDAAILTARVSRQRIWVSIRVIKMLALPVDICISAMPHRPHGTERAGVVWSGTTRGA
jgi:hypothetical protein